MIKYEDLKKLWNQVPIYKWEQLEENKWEDFQLSRAKINFSAVYDNRSEGDILLEAATINFNSRANIIVSGKKYFDIFNDFYPDYYNNDPLKVAWLECLDIYFNKLERWEVIVKERPTRVV